MLYMLYAKLWVGTAERQTVCAHTLKLPSRKEAANAGNAHSSWGHHSATSCRHTLCCELVLSPHGGSAEDAGYILVSLSTAQRSVGAQQRLYQGDRASCTPYRH